MVVSPVYQINGQRGGCCKHSALLRQPSIKRPLALHFAFADNAFLFRDKGTAPGCTSGFCQGLTVIKCQVSGTKRQVRGGVALHHGPQDQASDLEAPSPGGCGLTLRNSGDKR